MIYYRVLNASAMCVFFAKSTEKIKKEAGERAPGRAEQCSYLRSP